MRGCPIQAALNELPQCDSGALWISDDGKAAFSGYVRGRHANMGSKFLRLCQSGLNILHGHVVDPIRRHASLLTGRADHSRHRTITDHEHVVPIAATHIHRVRSPAEQVGVEFAARIRVLCDQFAPAEETGRFIFFLIAFVFVAHVLVSCIGWSVRLSKNLIEFVKRTAPAVAVIRPTLVIFNSDLPQFQQCAIGVRFEADLDDGVSWIEFRIPLPTPGE